MRILKALVAASLIFPFLVSAQDFSTEVRLADRSDWWSVLNENFYWPIEKPASVEISAENFEIAGIALEHDATLRAAVGKFGRAIPAIRGSSSAVRRQVCYVAAHNPPARLIFEEGDANLSFYLFTDARTWNGQALCTESSHVTAELRTKSGLGLGMAPADVEKILGKADISNPNKMVYQREIEKQTADDKLAELRKEHSDLSEKEFHDTYDAYELELFIEARFTDGKLTYLAVSRAENY